MAKPNQKSQGIPDHLVGLLAAADTRHGLPPGTMYSIMQQEVGGQFDKYLADPSAYHYQADAQGRRIAPHTGKISTAFGPFGILESTAAKPGYGVAPLANKSLEEQVRFASDYLAARSAKGGLKAGLAGYGEGEKYAAQVESRLTGKNPSMVVMDDIVQPVPEPVAVAQALPPLTPVADAAREVVAAAPAPVPAVVPVVEQGADPWQRFVAATPQQVQASDLQYGAARPAMPQVNTPDFMASVASAGQNTTPNFRMFSAMRARV